MMNSEIGITPFFLEGEFGPLFCIYLTPLHSAVRGQILYLHPFAEEMHKSRRMAALQARRLAAAGFAVLQVDLSGCGDSWGDFGDARWELWIDDAICAITWLRGRDKGLPLLLWGLRLGATFTVDLADRVSGINSTMLWQPVTNGELFLNQFLRIKLASEMLSDGRVQTGTHQLRERLKDGEPIEVGGYLLAAELAKSIATLRLEAMAPPGRAIWIDVTADPNSPATSANQKVIHEWKAKGCVLQSIRVEGEPFWVTQEITECYTLLDATTNAMEWILL